MERKVKSQVRGYRTQDGAGVSLVRVLGNTTVEEFDPILMLDSFDSENPKDYIAGFPMHPHRGIETISYIFQGKMTHRDSLGNEDTIADGEVQWMTAGSGIMHEEKLPASERRAPRNAGRPLFALFRTVSGLECRLFCRPCPCRRNAPDSPAGKARRGRGQCPTS